MKIFIDFDNTIVNTTKATCDYYNKLHPEKEKLDWTKVTEFNFKPYKINESELIRIFSTKKFYTYYLKPYNGVIEVLKELSQYADLVLVTVCDDKSVQRKLEWLKQYKISDLFASKIFLSQKYKMNKSLIDMSKSILIDDHIDNHKSSNAKYKFCFKDQPNRNWCPSPTEAIIFDEWDSSALERIKFIIKTEEIVSLK